MGLYFDDSHIGDFSECFHNEVGPNDGSCYIIQQYTGIKDSKGKEIYEGDIISYVLEYNVKYLTRGEVKYNDYYFYVENTKSFAQNEDDAKSNTWVEIKNPAVVAGTFNVIIYHSNYEVIGNVMENPELLNE